jgi:hypothetical protein
MSVSMRRRANSCALALVAALAVAGCGGDEPSGIAIEGNYSLEQAQLFEDFPLYALGESYGDLPLVAVQRTFDASVEPPPVRPNYVDFIYGTCEPAAGSEGRCTPPLSVQVWAACERNPLVYGPEAGQERPIEVRGVPGYFYEGGGRLELSTGTSTVVIFASGRQAALAAAAVLRGVNNPVTAEENLPAPAYTRAEGGIVSVIPCAYEDPTQQIAQDPDKARRVERALQTSLDAGAARKDNPPVREIDCFRSPVPTRAGALADAHECMIGWDDGSFVTWCVLSGKAKLLRATVPEGCEQAANGQTSFVPAVDPGATAPMRWAGHAEDVCLRWREREGETIAELDQDLLNEDLSYIWFVLRPYEAGLVRDLRVIPGRTGPARRAVALYTKRIASIDAGLSTWQKGDREAALAHFDRAEKLSLPLSRLFGAVHADACAPF